MKKVDPQEILDVLTRLTYEAWDEYDLAKKNAMDDKDETTYCWGKITALRIAYFKVKHALEK